MDDISDIVQWEEPGVSDRRSFLRDSAGVLFGIAAIFIPGTAGAKGGWNISYGLARGDKGLVTLGKRYDELKKTLSPSLLRKLVIEKSPQGNYFLVLKLNTSANRAQRMISAHKRNGIDAALRRYCACDVVFPPKGSPAPKPAPQPKLQPRPAPAPRPSPQPAPPPRPAPTPTPTYSPRPAQRLTPPGARVIRHPDYTSYSNLNLNNLESVLRQQFSHEKQRGNLSGGEVLYAYVEAGYDMPVMINSDKRVAGAWSSAEKFLERVETADFYASVSNSGLSRPGSLVSALPAGARSRSIIGNSGTFSGEGAVIYAQKQGSRYYQSFKVVMGITGRSSRARKTAALSRLSRIIYEAMRSKYVIE